VDHNDAKILKKENAFTGKISQINLYTFQFRKFDQTFSNPLTFEIFERKPVIGILLHDPVRDEVALVEQFRLGAEIARLNGEDINPYLQECVAGIIDAGETPEQAALRETVEESGLTLRRLEFVKRLLPSAGGCSEVIYLFYGEVDLSNIKETIFGQAEEQENIRVHILKTADAIHMEKEGTICTLIGSYMLQWLENQQLKQKL